MNDLQRCHSGVVRRRKGGRHCVTKHESHYDISAELGLAQRELNDGLADRDKNEAWGGGGEGYSRRENAADAPPCRSLMRWRWTGGAKVNSEARISTVSPNMATMKREIATMGDVLGIVAMPMMTEENTHIKQDAMEKRRPRGT